MPLWIIATLFAAAVQTLRFMLHRALAQGALSSTGSTFSRFAYAAPLAVLVTVGYLLWTGKGIPAIGPWLLPWALLGGLGQIFATIFVVKLFGERNFATGITLKKTEVFQTALVGFALLGETVSSLGWLAIGIGFCAVMLLSPPPGGGFSAGRRSILLGLGSGFCFALAGVGYRAATLAFETEDPVLRAGLALSLVTLCQALGMAVWLRFREPGQLTACWRARGTAFWLGLTSMAGSFGWFIAFTLQTAAYVYALGQVELAFSLAVSVLVYRERVVLREVLGIAALGGSILLLIWPH